MAVRSVGIDLSISGMHRAEAIDATGQRCGHLSFRTSPEGLEALANLCFQADSIPTIVMEPTGLVWLPIMLFLKARCPEVVLVRAKEQKVAALRRVLREHAKSDRIDAVTLARLPLVDPEHLEPANIVSPEMQRLDRLTRRRDLECKSMANRKTRISSFLMGIFPGLWECFEDPFNARARWVYRHWLNPFRVRRLTALRVESAFHKLTPNCPTAVIEGEAAALIAMLGRLAESYRLAYEAGLMTDASFDSWAGEISMELDLMEAEERQIAVLDEQIGVLYPQVDPKGHLRTMPGMGPRVTPLIIAAVGDIRRFSDVRAFCQWTGVLPRSHQSSHTQLKGLGMGKAGPARVKRALYQAAEFARRWDPELAAVYYRQMVDHGKTHNQAMGAVMSHLAARIYVILRDQRPYELKGVDGRGISRVAAGKFIREHLRVPEEVRKTRRQHQRLPKKTIREAILKAMEARQEDATAYEAATAPQRGDSIPTRLRHEYNARQEAEQLVASAS
jgi:transposase